MESSGDVAGEPLTVHAMSQSLVVLAGLPGAGKSTLLDKLHDTEGIVVLDSEQMRSRLRAVMPECVPYCWYRPVVHIAHRTRIGWYCLVRPGPVVAHEPATRATTRAMLVLFGWLTGRRRLMVWVAVTPADALAGQRTRGRFVSRRSFRGHVHRAARVRQVLAARGRLRGWAEVSVRRRDELADGFRIEVS